MKRGVLGTVVVLAVGVLPVLGETGSGSRWTEEDFYRKARNARPYVVVPSKDLASAQTIIGSSRFYHVQDGDTFLDLARYYGLGYNEIKAANPGVDEWIPPEGQAILLPTEWALPQVSEYRGVVVNIPEMRLYYFHRRKGNSPLLVSTYPVGLGRDDWRTPQGKFKIRGKTKNPQWNIPESIRKEHIAERNDYRTFIPGGAPDNPLGKHRIELTLPMYAIHGTNIPWGVGMQVSHGCIRLYPEDIEHLFPMVEIGAPGEFLYQPVKLGARNGRIYAEVHEDIYRLTPGVFQEARRIIDQLGWSHFIDYRRLERAVAEKSGVPLDITLGGSREDVPEEDLRPASSEQAPIRTL